MGNLIGDARKCLSNWMISDSDKRDLMQRHGIDEVRLMIELAKGLGPLSEVPISQFPVTIVGRVRDSGHLLIGCNLEFPGTSLGLTVHAEQFLFARAFHRGETIDEFALAEATPCGHCRQFILEFATAKNIRVHNGLGLNASIGELVPHGFAPEHLGVSGIAGPAERSLRLRSKTRVSDLARAALAAARKAHCPYSNVPSGVALQTKSGVLHAGSYIENVAFNPSLSPLHTAMIELIASGGRLRDIRGAALVQSCGPVDQSTIVKSLLKQIAPRARCSVLEASS